MREMLTSLNKEPRVTRKLIRLKRKSEVVRMLTRKTSQINPRRLSKSFQKFPKNIKSSITKNRKRNKINFMKLIIFTNFPKK